MLLGSLVFASSAMAQRPGWYNNYRPNSYYEHQNPYYYQQRQTISERLQNQRQRIDDGIRDRSLTASEINYLRNRQAALERELALTSRNGYMSSSQYDHFQTELDRMGDIIYKAKHNYNNNYYNNNFRRY